METSSNNDSVATAATSNYVKKFPSISTTATTFVDVAADDEATPRNPNFIASQMSIKDYQSYQQIGRLSLGPSSSINDYSRKQTTFVETSQIGNVFSQTINSQDLNSQIKIALNGTRIFFPLSVSLSNPLLIIITDSQFNQIQNYNSTTFYWIPLTLFDRNFLQNALK